MSTFFEGLRVIDSNVRVANFFVRVNRAEETITLMGDTTLAPQTRENNRGLTSDN